LKLPLTSRAFCCADIPCYFSPVLTLIKDRKLRVYSKARLCLFSWTAAELSQLQFLIQGLNHQAASRFAIYPEL